jgi:dihydrofolate reductase
MRKLIAFENTSLDGYFADKKNDMSWAHKHDPEWNAFASENARGGGLLLFGRITYDLMVSYWPTPMAAKNDPVLAERMNNLSKVVFSRTLERPSWNNARLVKDDMLDEVRRMKKESGDDMVILGSGSIVSQLTEEGLIDEYQIVVNPIVLGGGRTLFETVTRKLPLKLARTRAFGNGNVFLSYEKPK